MNPPKEIAQDSLQPDKWQELKQFTPARLALGRAGMSLPTHALLDFAKDHALARDAVHLPLDFHHLAEKLAPLAPKTLLLQSRADSPRCYLQRPDLGRLLNATSLASLQASAQPPYDVAIVIADGLSSSAIACHAVPFLQLLLPQLSQYRVAPLCLVKHARVAVGDVVASQLQARLCIVLIGERPGLSSPDSMGIYFTYAATLHSNDADRNCISNIHRNGLSYPQALIKLQFLIDTAQRLKFSGVHLKEESPLLLNTTLVER